MAENRNAQQVREITDKLEQGIKELFESERFKEYLRTMSKFYNYSFNNTLLIAMQKPEATYVAGYTSWQRNFDRQVLKGEKGIKILAPAPYKAQEEREKIDPLTQKPVIGTDGKAVTETVEVLRPAFKVVSVFDVSQTDGKELPDIIVDELKGTVENYEAFFDALKQVSPVPISFEDIPGGAKGFFSPVESRIAIQEGMSEIQTVKTAIHEIAHAKLHAVKPDEKTAPEDRKDRHTKEVEAESVAYTVCQRYGIETSDYSFGYIAGWSSGKETKELKSSLDTIRKTAAEMIEGIDAKLKVLLAEKAQSVEQEALLEEKPEAPIYRETANYAYEAGIYSEKDLGPLADYIDYERYGHDIAYDEQGRFTDEGYVRVASERWDRQFNGELDDIPDEYRITGSGEDAERDSTIAVLVVEPGKEPYVKEIDSGLESLQHEVGGCIEAIYPYEDPVALVCNEEGKLEGLPLNRALRDEDGDIYDVVAGTFMVVGLTDDSFGSLTVEQMQKFADHFKVPEQFVKLGDKIVAIPMISKEQQKQESIEQKDFEMNADTSGLTVAGHIGTWHTIDQHEVGGHSFYLMEHDTYGDEAACIIVDERGKLVLDDVYNGFDDDTLRLLDLEVKEVPEMPDPALSVQDMKDYGYAWAGVLPAGQEAAEKALEKGCEVYRLYSDNTEGLCVDAKEIADHAAKGGMLGISKESWMAALEKENYLKAAEMSMEDDYGMIDGIINNGPKEDKTAAVKAPETGEKSSIMERLKSAKAEKQKECCPPQKHKGEIEL